RYAAPCFALSSQEYRAGRCCKCGKLNCAREYGLKITKRILTYKEARVRSAPFNGHRASVPLLKKPEIQNIASTPRLVKLQTKLRNSPPLRKPAQLAGGIHNHPCRNL